MTVPSRKNIRIAVLAVLVVACMLVAGQLARPKQEQVVEEGNAELRAIARNVASRF